MDAQRLIEQLQEAGISLEADADEIVYQGPRDVVTAGLLERLQDRKPEVLQELYQRQEREREAVAADYWQRLQEIYDRAGRPPADTWLTDTVRSAERRAGDAWIRARTERTHKAHNEALNTLELWYLTAREEIRGAEAFPGGKLKGVRN